MFHFSLTFILVNLFQAKTFGRIYNGVLRVAFTRNNVRIVIHAPKDVAIEISKDIDNRIKDAPTWRTGAPKPKFVLPI